MARRYRSVSEMVRELSDDQEFADRFDREAAKRSLAQKLFSMRCAYGITQAEMAKQLGCTQGRISKLEHSPYDAIKVGDLMAYAKAVGRGISIAFLKTTTAGFVNYHISELKRHLRHLSELARGDESISKGIAKLLDDQIPGLLQTLLEVAQDIESPDNDTGKADQPTLSVSAPIEDIAAEGELVKAP